MISRIGNGSTFKRASKPELSYVAQDENGDVVAHWGVMPLRLNILGRTQLMTLWCDTMVHRSARRHSLTQRMHDAFTKAIKASDIVVSCGNPNQKNLILNLRNLTFLFNVDTYTLRFETAKASLPVLAPEDAPSLIDAPYQLEIDRPLDDDIDELWDSIGQKEHLSLVRDRKYLQWRYLDHPQNDYRTFTLTQGGQAVGLCVCKEEEDHVRVYELESLYKNTWLARKLIREVSEHYSNSERSYIECVARDEWFFDDALQGFKKQRHFDHHFFVTSTHQEGVFLYENPRNWTVTLSLNEL